jgi:hypothetical protein
VSNPERRRAYDMWLRAHAAPPRAVQGFPADVDQWMRSVLAEYHEAPTAPFAGRFDLVLETPAPSSGPALRQGLSAPRPRPLAHRVHAVPRRQCGPPRSPALHGRGPHGGEPASRSSRPFSRRASITPRSGHGTAA